MNNIKYEVMDYVGIVTLSRAPVNALNLEMYGEIADLFTDISKDVGVRAVLIRSDVKHFCAGNDVAEFSMFNEDYLNATTMRMNRALFNCKKPIICAVHGAVMGEGMALVSASDILLATKNSKFSIAEVNVGLMGILSECSVAIPMQAIKYMSLTGISMTAKELYRYGSIFEIVEDEQLCQRGLELAKVIASKPPLAVQEIKFRIHNLQDVSVLMYKNAPMEYDCSLRLCQTEDHKEAYTSILEKRTPIFSGR